MDAAAFAGEGILPVGGGTLDQTASFMKALRYFRDEDARVKARTS